MSEKVRLIGGPADGTLISGKGQQMIGFPLDRNLNLLKTKDEPYAFAVYKLNSAGNYDFCFAQRKEPEKPFEVEFVDGPMAGVLPFAQAIQLYDTPCRAPLDAESKPLKQGAKVAQIAEYKRKMIDGVWKMALARIIDNPTEIEQMGDRMAEDQLVRELQVFTNQQLVNELLSRPGFVGVILMYPGELVGNWQLKKGATFAIGIGRQLDTEKAKTMLRSAIGSLEKQD